MKTETKNEVKVVLQALNLKKLKVKLVGKTSLLMDRFPDEVKKEILEKQTGISKGNKKKIRDINNEVQRSIHFTSDGQVGFPASGFKRGMMECTSFVGDRMFSKKLVSGAVRITNTVDGLIPIKFKKQDILEAQINEQTKFLPQFHDWSCELEIKYDANNISATDIITLINYSGFYVGIGQNRPKGKGGGSGENGTYEVLAS